MTIRQGQDRSACAAALSVPSPSAARAAALALLALTLLGACVRASGPASQPAEPPTSVAPPPATSRPDAVAVPEAGGAETASCTGAALSESVMAAADIETMSPALWGDMLRGIYLAEWDAQLDYLAGLLDAIRAADQVIDAGAAAMSAIEVFEAALTRSSSDRSEAARRYQTAHLRLLAARSVFGSVEDERRRNATSHTVDELIEQVHQEVPARVLEVLETGARRRYEDALGTLRLDVSMAVALAEAAHEQKRELARLVDYHYPPDWAPVKSSDLRYAASNDPALAALENELRPYRDETSDPYDSAYRLITRARNAGRDLVASSTWCE